MYNVKVLCFDVVGTLVDWRGSIVNQLGDCPQADLVAREWCRYYANGTFKYKSDLVNKGIELIIQYNLDQYVNANNFVNTWTNLTPWPDTLEAFKLLREKYTLVALTNVTTETVVRLCKNTGLQFDFIYSAELTGFKKPHPLVYQRVCEILRAQPDEVMLVAAHRFDLEAAGKAGMETCYVERNDDQGADPFYPDREIKSLMELV